MLLKPKLSTNSTCKSQIIPTIPTKKKTRNVGVVNSKAHIQKHLTHLYKLDVHPKELIFENFEVNEVYKKSIQVTNSGRNTARFEVLQLQVGSEFKFELLSKKSTLVPGMSATLQVYLHPKKVSDKTETLNIKVEKGQTVQVVLKAKRNPPNLTLTGRDLEFFVEKQMVDIGYFLVSTNTVLDMCLVHEGATARYYVLSSEKHKDVLETDLSYLRTRQLYLDNFIIKPVYFNMINDIQCKLSLEFTPKHCGVCSDTVLFLCDNGATNIVTFKGYGVKFVNSHIDFENVESKDNFPVTMNMDDSSCEWYYDMGPVDADVVKGTVTIKNICPAKNKIPYEWRVEPISCNQRVPIPPDNVILTPSVGELPYESSVSFKVICKIPSEIYKEAGFVARLFINLPRGAVLEQDFDLKTQLTDDEMLQTEENYDFDIRSIPSFIIPSDTEMVSVCVGSIEFALDCHRKVAISFNPYFIDFQAPLTVNDETKQCVIVKNECPLTLTCQWSFRIDDKFITVKTIPINFTLGPYEEEPVQIRIKPVSPEPFEVEIVCLIAENPLYRPKLKIRGNVTAGDIEVLEDIVNIGCVKHGDVIEVPIEFKNNFHNKTEWNIYKIKESLQEPDPCLNKLLTTMKNLYSIQYTPQKTSTSEIESVRECQMYKIEKELTRNKCDTNTCSPYRTNKGGLIDNFKKIFLEISHETDRRNCTKSVKSQTETCTHRKDHLKKTCKAKDSHVIENINEDTANSLFDQLEVVSLKNTDDTEPILTGFVSNSDISDRRGMLKLLSEFPGLVYKLLELRVENCIRHKLVVADFCPSLISLQPKVLHIGHTSPHVKSVLSVTLMNHTKCSWEYFWGQPEDIEEATLEVTIDKKQGVLGPEQKQPVLLSFQPFMTVMLEKVFVPCYIEGLKEPLRLIIEFKVEDLAVHISWDTYEKMKMSYHWPDEELIPEKIKWCGLDVLHTYTKPIPTESRSSSSLYDRPQSKEENTLTSRSYSVVSIRNFNFVEKNVQNLIKNSENIPEAEDESLIKLSTVSMGQFETLLYSQYKAIFRQFLHFNDVYYKTPTKRTITIVNSTTNPCKFKIRVGYFMPQIKEKQEKYVIPTKRKFTTNWEDLLDIQKGLVISVDKAQYEITNGALDVEVWVYAHSWGLYMDTITLEFDSLPPFHIPVGVSIRHPPVYFTPLSCFYTLTPIYEFTPISFTSSDEFIIIPIENTSGLPLKIFWNIGNKKDGENEESSKIALDLIYFEDFKGKPSLPEQSKTHAFYVDENTRLMKLNINDRKQMLTIHFNTDLLGPNTDATIYNSYVSGYVGVDPGLKNMGVYRELKRLSCQVRASAGATRLQFKQYTPQDCLFWFQASRIYSSPTKVEKEKTFQVENLHNFSTACDIQIQEPFSIVQVIIAEHPVDCTSPVQLLPKHTMHITVRCTLTPDSVDKLDTDPNTVSHEQFVCRKSLDVLYNQNQSVTSLTLEVQIESPIMKLSTHEIHFPTVYVGDTAVKFFTIEIIHGNTKDIQIPKACNLSPFNFHIERNASKVILHLRVTFTPRESKYYAEEFQFSVHRRYKTLQVFGCADEDQKYHV